MNSSNTDIVIAAREHAGRLNNSNSFSEKWQSEAGLFFAGLTLTDNSSKSRLSASEAGELMFELGKYSNDRGFNFSIAAHLFAGALPVSSHGKNPVHAECLLRISNGAICANAMTESSSGSDAFKMKTVAVRKGNSFLLSGSKTYVTNGPVADYFIVYALTDPSKGFFGGVTCFLLDQLKHKFQLSSPFEKVSLKTSPMCELFFDECEVGEEYIIGKEGGGAMIFMESMDWERACIAAMHAGTIAQLCAVAGNHSKTRIRVDKSLAQFQGVQFHMAEIAVLAETSRLMAMKAAKLVDEKRGTVAAAQAKILASESFLKAASLASTVMGGSGVMNSGLASALADAQAALIYSGPNDILRELIASGI